MDIIEQFILIAVVASAIFGAEVWLAKRLSKKSVKTGKE